MLKYRFYYYYRVVRVGLADYTTLHFLYTRRDLYMLILNGPPVSFAIYQIYMDYIYKSGSKPFFYATLTFVFCVDLNGNEIYLSTSTLIRFFLLPKNYFPSGIYKNYRSNASMKKLMKKRKHLIKSLA